MKRARKAPFRFEESDALNRSVAARKGGAEWTEFASVWRQVIMHFCGPVILWIALWTMLVIVGLLGKWVS